MQLQCTQLETYNISADTFSPCKISCQGVRR